MAKLGDMRISVDIINGYGIRQLEVIRNGLTDTINNLKDMENKVCIKCGGDLIEKHSFEKVKDMICIKCGEGYFIKTDDDDETLKPETTPIVHTTWGHK